jgi:ATP-binding cassette, subfamily B, bacterial MsbA
VNKGKRVTYLKYFGFLSKSWGLIIAGVISGLLSSIFEGLGISFIIPILESNKLTNASDIPSEKLTNISDIPFPFNKFSELFSGMNFNELLLIVAILLFLSIVLKNIFLFGNVVINGRLQIIVVKHFRMACLEQIMKAGMSYINKNKTGYFHTILVPYSTELGAFVKMVGELILILFRITIYLIMVILLSWQMTLIAVLLGAVASLSLRKVLKNSARIGTICGEEFSHHNAVMLELIASIKVSHIFSREKKSIDYCANKIDYLNRLLFKMTKIGGMVQPLYETVALFCLSTLMVFGSILMTDRSGFNFSSFAIFLVIFQRLSGTMMQLNRLRVGFVGDFPKYREVFNFLNPEGKRQLHNGTRPFLMMKKGIRLEGVTFAYDINEPLIFKDSSFEIPVRSKVGVVGGSGAGKSTLIELLLRFYDPIKGQIFVDDVDLKKLDIFTFRKCIGVVSQDTFLFNDTIGKNIAYAKPEASLYEIENAARLAHAHNFIQEMPEGYDTLVGDRGVLLSGGQKQRIAIARAIIINPQILVFDEATSALDSASEKIVQRALDEVGDEKTVITIAHRLSTIFDSDKILVLDKGRVVEEGKHEELMSLNGLYSNLVNLQIKQNGSTKQ